MLRRLHLAFLLAVASLLATPAAAQLGDYEREKIEGALHAPAVQMKPEIFDGKAFNPAVDVGTAHGYMNGFVKGLNNAIRAINGMSGPGRNSDAGRRLTAEAQEKIAYSNAMRGAFPAFEQAKKSGAAPAPAPLAPAPAQSAAPPGTGGQPVASDTLADLRMKLGVVDDLMGAGKFDGRAFAESLDMDEARAFRGDLIAAVNASVAALGAASAADRNSAEGKALEGRVDTALADARRLDGALANHNVVVQRREMEARDRQRAEDNARREAEAGAAAAKAGRDAEAAAAAAEKRGAARAGLGDACKAFDDEVMSRRTARSMAKLIEDREGNSYGPKDMPEFLKATGKVAEACAKPEYAEIRAIGCSDNAVEDPKTWCEVAIGARAAFKAQIVKPLPSWKELAEHRYQNHDQLAAKHGWVEIEGPTTFAGAVSFDRMMYTNLADFGPDKQRELFAELGVKAQDYPYYEDVMEYVEELKESIEEGAGEWPPASRAPTGEDSNYGTELAARLIVERWHRDADVKDAWLGRASWNVVKNSLGVILRRTLPGYVKFKLPDDPFCQLRSFTLTEAYTGGGSFEPATGVRFGYVRFQDCERP